MRGMVPPREQYGKLFSDVLSSDALFGKDRLFPDSKAFLDASPLYDMETILSEYGKLGERPPASQLEAFLREHFDLSGPSSSYSDDLDIRSHIRKLWSVLRRKPDEAEGRGTAIPLSSDYFVPGGRFREMYYWDSYFSMLGMYADGETDLVRSLMRNFSGLIDRLGFIPNGNRTYYLGRSQPPFFSHMVEDLAGKADGDGAYAEYLPELLAEHRFWMDGAESLQSPGECCLRTVRLDDGTILNRCYDTCDGPREEMYRNDVKMAEGLGKAGRERLFRSLRAAAESGWDFSSRWLSDPYDLSTIRTVDIIPVDLNSLLYHHEAVLARACGLSGDGEGKRRFSDLAELRKRAVREHLWNEEEGFFLDLSIPDGKHTGVLSLAGVYPLYEKIATSGQAAAVAERVRRDFLKEGGVVTTLLRTGEQWDYPNAWAPLQWIAYTGLMNYGFEDLAEEIRTRWMRMVEDVYGRTHRLLEKYDAVDLSDGGGGEYPNQDGFGWTNGVYSAFAAAGKPL